MRLTGVNHITINVKDMSATLAFYGELLGLERLPSVEMSDHTLDYFKLPGGPLLELVRYRYPTRDPGAQATDLGTARHLAFTTDDVYAFEQMLTQAGYPFHVPVHHVPELGFTGGLTRDPNGFELEFLQYD